MTKTRVVIMGAAGRDFHNFNVFFRTRADYDVVAFTATQIPNIDGRRYPASLSGPLYPNGIPIFPESELSAFIAKEKITLVIFSYSDVSHEYVMQRGSIALAAGANYMLLAPAQTQVKLGKPVVAITAVRTGCGKSQTSRKVVQLLTAAGKKVVAVRHPMPYGDLEKQICQRFASYDDLAKHHCTIEEREEYEPYLDAGLVVYAGIDYEKIGAAAASEADVVVWDGGNNDAPFFKPDLHLTVLDPLRAGHERIFYPGEVNFLLGQVLVINKYEQATPEQLQILQTNIAAHNPRAKVINAASTLLIDEGERLRGKKVLVIEDGPTVTHGGMGYGAGFVAAKRYGAQIVDPRPFAVGSIKAAFANYAHLESVLPALGYFPEQLRELETTINAAACDFVIIASPIDLGKLLKITKPAVRVRYELDEIGTPNLQTVLAPFLQ